VWNSTAQSFKNLKLLIANEADGWPVQPQYWHVALIDGGRARELREMNFQFCEHVCPIESFYQGHTRSFAKRESQGRSPGLLAI
jgi:hypothetical protein